MIENINKLDKILSYFKFLQPVPEAVQKRITEFKKKTIINSLKFYGQYNIFFGSAVRFNLLLRKIGLNYTILQAKIILFIISALTGIAILTGISLNLNLKDISIEKNNTGVIKEKNKPTAPEDLPEIDKNTEKTEAIDSISSKKHNIINYRLGIKAIESSENDNILADVIKNKLYSSLINEKGGSRVVLRKSGGIEKSVNRLLMGRISKIGNTYLLSISVTSAESGKILFDRKYTFKDSDDSNEVLNNIAGEIAADDNIW